MGTSEDSGTISAAGRTRGTCLPLVQGPEGGSVLRKIDRRSKPRPVCQLRAAGGPAYDIEEQWRPATIHSRYQDEYRFPQNDRDTVSPRGILRGGMKRLRFLMVLSNIRMGADSSGGGGEKIEYGTLGGGSLPGLAPLGFRAAPRLEPGLERPAGDGLEVARMGLAVVVEGEPE